MTAVSYWLKFKQHIWLPVLIIFAVLLYAHFSYGLPWRFNSPDEAANAYFALRLARGESLGAPDKLNAITQNPLVHPRSTHIVNNQLVPTSFIGLPIIYGFVGRMIGASALPYFTPLAAIFGLLAFWGIVKELSGKDAAWLALALLIFTPAVWYYHSRSFYHNALFLDLALVTIWSSLIMLKKTAAWRYLLTGIFFGLTIAVRTSEVFWFAAAGLLFLAAHWRQIKWRQLWLIIIGALAAFSPVFYHNYQIYGSLFSFGYRQNLLLTTDIQQTLSLLQQLILPFGFNPRIILSTTTNYLLKLNWWWAGLVAVGLIYFFINWRGQTKQAKVFMGLILFVSGWLMIVYGSWQFNDNPDPRAVTLGTSYARYWLPIYTLLLWPVGVWLDSLRQQKLGKEMIFGVIGVYLVFSTALVWWHPSEGLAQVKANVQRFNDWNIQMQRQTKPDSVIVTGLTDKIFWPERDVIYALVNPVDYESIGKLLTSGRSVYWFHPTWRADDLVTMNRRLANYGLSLTAQSLAWQDFSLYRLTLKQ
jgi:hypothetical protein